MLNYLHLGIVAPPRMVKNYFKKCVIIIRYSMRSELDTISGPIFSKS